MAFFSEQMHAFADKVVTSKDARNAAVVDLSNEAGRLLTQARSFLKNVSDTHRDMAASLRANLAAERRTQCEKAEALRDRIQHEHRAMRDRMQAMLGENQSRRRTEVGQLIQGFDSVRGELAADLQAAAKVWHDMQQRRSPKN